MSDQYKYIFKSGRRRKYVLRICKHCKSEFYTRADNKNVVRCRDCSHAHLRKPMVKCYVDGCEELNYSRGLCQFHYDRQYRGTELDAGYYGSKLLDFEVNESGCFICTSHKPAGNGYCFMVVNGRNVYIHRFVYEECFGEIPEGLHIRHKCDTPTCINPEHLETGTHQDNMRDMVERKRHNYGEKSPVAKLTNKDVLEIKTMLSKGIMQKDIAKKYKVNPATISMINTGKNWGHLTCPTTEKRKD